MPKNSPQEDEQVLRNFKAGVVFSYLCTGDDSHLPPSTVDVQLTVMCCAGLYFYGNSGPKVALV
jgi:hypothetical protein